MNAIGQVILMGAPWVLFVLAGIVAGRMIRFAALWAIDWRMRRRIVRELEAVIGDIRRVRRSHLV